MMEDDITIITTKWAIITQKMVVQTIDTPQGPMQVQQPIQVPVVFRSLKEAQRYVEENYKNADQIVLQKIQYDDMQEKQVEYYYREEEDSCH